MKVRLRGPVLGIEVEFNPGEQVLSLLGLGNLTPTPEQLDSCKGVAVTARLPLPVPSERRQDSPERLRQGWYYGDPRARFDDRETYADEFAIDTDRNHQLCREIAWHPALRTVTICPAAPLNGRRGGAFQIIADPKSVIHGESECEGSLGDVSSE